MGSVQTQDQSADAGVTSYIKGKAHLGTWDSSVNNMGSTLRILSRRMTRSNLLTKDFSISEWKISCTTTPARSCLEDTGT